MIDPDKLNEGSERSRNQSAVRHNNIKNIFQKGLGEIIPKRKGGVALEFYAGTGHSILASAKGLKHIVFEQDGKRAAAYKRRVPSSNVITGKWEDNLEEIKLGDLDVCAVDIDPWGRPFDAIKAFLRMRILSSLCYCS